jgi:glycerate kinase
MAAQPDGVVGSQQVTIEAKLAAMMRILITPDAFKGSLTSFEAAVAMAAGIRTVIPKGETITMPLADGGEGTLDVLLPVLSGELRNNILFFQYEGRPHALIESAALIGFSTQLMQIPVFERGSSILGKAVSLVLDEGIRDIWIALGGSASSDGGLGLLIALGCSVTDLEGNQVSADLQGLLQAKQINIGNLDQRLGDVRITVLSDVRNLLCGEYGAVCVYGPQKGIKDSELAGLDAAMLRWAGMCEKTFDISAQYDSGAGAAGGIGFALNLLGGKIVSGAQFIMQRCGFNQVLKTVNWVVTGEGRSDNQTLNGKLPVIVAKAARKQGVKVALISGDIEPSAALARAFDAVISVRPDGMSIHDAMQNAEMLLRNATAMWADSI